MTIELTTLGKLKTAIVSFVEETEAIYTHLGHQYAVISKELDVSFQKTGAFASSLKNREGSFSTHVESLISQTSQLVTEGLREYARLHQEREEAFSHIQEKMETIRGIDDAVGGISFATEDMELISLNALTSAVKAGRAGGAFSYITSELRRLAGRTREATQLLTAEGKDIQETYGSLNATMKQSAAQQEEVFSTFTEHITIAKNKVLEQSVVSAEKLERLKQEAGETKPHILKLLEEVQFHDLIRQSIEQITTALNAVEMNRDISREERLDDLAYLITFPEISKDIIQYVHERLDDNVAAFRKEITAVNHAILQAGRLQQDLREGEGSIRTFRDSYQEAVEALHTLMKDLEASRSRSKGNEKLNKELLKKVRTLVYSLEDFSSLVSRFHNIQVASRIEVSKQSALKSMESTVEDMNILAERIESFVEASLSSMRRFLKDAQKEYANLSEFVEQEENFMQSFNQTMIGQTMEFEELSRRISEDLAHFALFSGTFSREFERSKHEVARLEEIQGQLKNIEQLLTELKDEAQQKLNESLERSGLEEWNIQNKRLVDTIEGFTIYRHKKYAAQVAGLDLDGGAEEGEVTFF